MELLLIRTLVAVAESGSFTAAAERLYVTQSAVSRRIRQLEEHYGATLIQRGRERVEPTAAGKLVIEKARVMLDIEREIEQTVTAHKRRERISFCCTPCFGTGRLPDIFERYIGANGLSFDFNVVFEMPEDVLDGLATGRFDMAVVEHCDELDLTDSESWQLPVDHMVFVSAPALGISEAVVPLDALICQRLFLKTHNGCAYRFLTRRLRQQGRSLDDFSTISYFDDLIGVVRQVVAGHGIGFVSRELVLHDLESGLLREHRVEGFDHVRQRTLLIAPRLLRTDLIRSFVASLCEAMGSQTPADLTGV